MWSLFPGNRLQCGIRRALWTLLGTIAAAPLTGLLVSVNPLAGRLVVAALFGLALARPAAALLCVAGLVPLGGVIASQLGMSYSLTSPLILACLSGWFWREALVPTPPILPAVRSLLTPVALLALVVVASVVVELAGLQPSVAYPTEYIRKLASFYAADYFAAPNRYETLASGLEFLSGLGLFSAAVVLADAPNGLPLSLARMTAAGAAGLGVLSVNRFAEVVIRNGATWDAFVHHLLTIRISTGFSDVNAAGSYFAKAAPTALGLGVGASGAAATTAVACVIAAALLLTGSRTAQFAVLIASVIAAPAALIRRGGRRDRRLLLGVVLVLSVAAAGFIIPIVAKNRYQAPLREAAQIRLDLARAAVTMVADEPLFGVGIGGFRGHSGSLMTKRLRDMFPRENAHNYYLQLLAELGLLGFAPFVWVLAAAGRRMWIGIRAGHGGSPAVGTAAGLLAFVLTWLAGHPTLMVEVGAAFWILVGAGIGMTSQPGDGRPAARRARWWSVALVVIALGIGLSIPMRAAEAIHRARLSGASIGCSAWMLDESGATVRWITASRAQFHLPGSATGVRIPLRLVSDDPAAEAVVVVLIDGRRVGDVRLPAGAWTTFSVMLPEGAADSLHRIEVEVGRWHVVDPPNPGDPVAGAIQMEKLAVTHRTAR
jgi:O-antigen ligase